MFGDDDTRNKAALPPDFLADNPDLHPPEGADERTWLLAQFRTINRGFMQVMPEPNDWHNLDLTMPQVRLLMALSGVGHMRMGALADTLAMRISTVTGIVDRLVERKLVRRVEDPDDRRAVVVQVTEEGAAIIAHLVQGNQRFIERITDHFTTDELRTVAKALALIYRVARTVRTPPPG